MVGGDMSVTYRKNSIAKDSCQNVLICLQTAKERCDGDLWWLEINFQQEIERENVDKGHSLENHTSNASTQTNGGEELTLQCCENALMNHHV